MGGKPIGKRPSIALSVVLTSSTGENMAESRERPHSIADNFGDRENWRRENRAGNAPEPIPEREGQDDKNRIKCKSFRKKNGRHRLAFD